MEYGKYPIIYKVILYMVLYIPGGWQEFFPSTVPSSLGFGTVCFFDLFSAEEIQKQMAGISWFSREKDGDVTWYSGC